MYTSKLRKVGGSVMLAVPPAVLEMLRLQAGATVKLEVERDRLIVEATRKKHYSLQELLAQCDACAPASREDKDWTGSASVGGELI